LVVITTNTVLATITPPHPQTHLRVTRHHGQKTDGRA